MVNFSCDECGAIYKKRQVANHMRSCRSQSVSCLDCLQHFYGRDFETHTTCISEAEKYQGALYRGKKGNQQNGQKRPMTEKEQWEQKQKQLRQQRQQEQKKAKEEEQKNAAAEKEEKDKKESETNDKGNDSEVTDKKKKDNKRKRDTENEEAQQGKEEKKKKKKKKQKDEATTENKKKKKSKKQKTGQEETNGHDASNGASDATAELRLDWATAIQETLKKAPERSMSAKQLKKEVVSELLAQAKSQLAEVFDAQLKQISSVERSGKKVTLKQK
ncbi:zf-LYAR domain-containing protein [Balamuthia mandrillaris]